MNKKLYCIQTACLIVVDHCTYLIASFSMEVLSSRLLFVITLTISLALARSRIIFCSKRRNCTYAFHRSNACFVLSLGNLTSTSRDRLNTSTSSCWNPRHNSVCLCCKLILSFTHRTSYRCWILLMMYIRPVYRSIHLPTCLLSTYLQRTYLSLCQIGRRPNLIVGCSVAYQILTLEVVGWLVPSFYPLAAGRYLFLYVICHRVSSKT